jgi:hypothetical protein
MKNAFIITEAYTSNKARSLRELLLLLREHTKMNIGLTGAREHCLCDLIITMDSFGIISTKERWILLDFIRVNRPINKRSNQFWWRRGAKKPRLKWLDEQIASLDV